MDEIAAEVAQDIRTQYTIAYHSTKSPTLGGYRQVHVEAKAKSMGRLSVRTRTGYYPRGGADADKGGEAALNTKERERRGNAALSDAGCRDDYWIWWGRRRWCVCGGLSSRRAGAEIWAKLEYLNPGGSVKDRAALGIVLDAERRGVLRAGWHDC